MTAFVTESLSVTCLLLGQGPLPSLLDRSPLRLLPLFPLLLCCEVFLASYHVRLHLVVMFIGEAVDWHCVLASWLEVLGCQRQDANWNGQMFWSTLGLSRKQCRLFREI